MLLQETGKRPQAQEAFERAVALDPEDALNWALLAQNHALRGRREEAQGSIATALSLDPEHPDVQSIHTFVSTLAGERGEAVDVSRSSLRADPTDADRREAHSTAIKARNPLYQALLRAGAWLGGLHPAARLLVIISPLLLNRVVPGAALLITPIVLLSWCLEPLLNLTLMATREGRGLLPRLTRIATTGFAVYLLAAAGCAILAVAVSPAWGWVGVGFALWALSLGQVHTVGERARRIALGVHVAGALLLLLGAVVLLTGAGDQVPDVAQTLWVAAVGVGGVLMLLLTAFV